MKKFETPVIEAMAFEVEDIITVSGEQGTTDCLDDL